MFLRRRPLLRAAVIGGGAYAAGKKSVQRPAEQAQQDQQDQRADQVEDEQNERIASPEQRRQAQQGTGRPAAADGRGGAVPKPSMLDQLNQLNRLHQQGALTDHEFSAAKAKLLGG
jgi:hypothetical protein